MDPRLIRARIEETVVRSLIHPNQPLGGSAGVLMNLQKPYMMLKNINMPRTCPIDSEREASDLSMSLLATDDSSRSGSCSE